MDFRFIAVLMILMAILDFMGRLARKRAAAARGEDGDSLDGVDVLKALTGEEPEGPEARAAATPPVRVERDRAAPAILQRAEAQAPPAAGVPTARSPVQMTGPRVSAAAPPVPVREPRVLELRDRAPREIQVRSRDPRPTEQLPSPPDLPPAREVVARTAEPGAQLLPDPPPSTRRSRSAAVGRRLGFGSAADLRRLVVAREVLGPPLAMRDE